MPADSVEGLLRQLAPEVLGVLLRRHSQFDACEDAVQEALLDAALQWPSEGVPEHPRAWLITVASRRLTDAWRAEHARRDREDADFAAVPASELRAPAPADEVPSADDTLTLLFLCCHPSLSPSSQLALTLRAVGGLTTAEIARAFLVPDATMGQRISRAKATIKDGGGSFSMPPDDERDARLKVVLRALRHLQRGLHRDVGPVAAAPRPGHGGDPADPTRPPATARRRRGRRTARAHAPDRGASRSAHRPRRLAVPLAEQDRSLWRDDLIREGPELIAATLPRARLGPYQLQAAIAAAEAPSPEETDWPQVLALYEAPRARGPEPDGHAQPSRRARDGPRPHSGLDLLATLEDDERLAGHHRLTSVRAHPRGHGDTAAAREAFKLAARRTTSVPEQRHLERRAARLSAG